MEPPVSSFSIPDLNQLLSAFLLYPSSTVFTMHWLLSVNKLVFYCFFSVGNFCCFQKLPLIDFFNKGSSLFLIYFIQALFPPKFVSPAGVLSPCYYCISYLISLSTFSEIFNSFNIFFSMYSSFLLDNKSTILISH